MVEMSCEEHDQLAASTQFITHTVGRMLGAMQARRGGPGPYAPAHPWPPARLPLRRQTRAAAAWPAARRPAACLTHTPPPRPALPPPQLQATPIDTKGFQSLLSLVDNTANDSFDLYYGLFMWAGLAMRGGAGADLCGAGRCGAGRWRPQRRPLALASPACTRGADRHLPRPSLLPAGTTRLGLGVMGEGQGQQLACTCGSVASYYF